MDLYQIALLLWLMETFVLPLLCGLAGGAIGGWWMHRRFEKKLLQTQHVGAFDVNDIVIPQAPEAASKENDEETVGVAPEAAGPDDPAVIEIPGPLEQLVLEIANECEDRPLEPTEEQIGRVAHALWIEGGQQEGMQEEDWEDSKDLLSAVLAS